MQLLTKSEKTLLLDSLEIHSQSVLKLLTETRKLNLPDKSIYARYKKINNLIKKIS